MKLPALLRKLCDRASVSQTVFMKHFWPLYLRLEQLADEQAPKPAYFRFLTLLGRALVCL